MVTVAGLLFALVTLLSALTAQRLGRQECSRVARLLTAVHARRSSESGGALGESPPSLDPTEGRLTDGELVRLARGSPDSRTRLLAFDELVGRYELSRALHKIIGRGVGRVALVAGGAGAALALALGLPALTAERGLLSAGCLLLGGGASALAAWQARKHEQALREWRRALSGLRRELDSKSTSG